MCKEYIALQSCMLKGLNIKTGKSPTIKISDIEALDGLMHTSNGSRIIRDDIAPFSMFKIIRNYNSKTKHLESIEFTGYRDHTYETNFLYDKITRQQKKINSLNNTITQDLKDLAKLQTLNNNTPLFSSQDVLDFMIKYK